LTGRFPDVSCCQRVSQIKPSPGKPSADMLELVIFIVIYFVVANFVLPRFGIQPG
jgi:hypothetical protein